MRETKQKQVVLNAVLNSCDHPTAETILMRCKAELPSVNLATVYRNLNALSLENKIRRLAISGGDRFDKTLHSHAHFKCVNCHCVFDIDNVNISDIIENAKGSVNTVLGIDLTVNGVCLSCAKNS